MVGLSSKTVVITGGAKGIGRETTRRFLSEGSRVAVIDRDVDACSRLESDFPEIAMVITADVSRYEEIIEAFWEIDRHLDGPDVLINNAGISVQKPFLEITPEQWQEIIGVDLSGVFFAAQEAARRMLKRGSGVIINMSSTNALRGYPLYADYNAAKAGVISLTRTMALELAPVVRAIAVCPGYVRTPMQEREYSRDMMEKLEQEIPLKRQADPKEIAALFAFLASDEAAFITGSEIVIDGGEIIGTAAGRK